MSASRISNYDDYNDYIDLDQVLEQDGRSTSASSGSRTLHRPRNHRISLQSVNDDELLRLTRSLVTPVPTSRCDLRDEDDIKSRHSWRVHGDKNLAYRTCVSPGTAGRDHRCESVMLFRRLNNVDGDENEVDDVSVDLVASDLRDFIDPVMFEGSISRPGSRAPENRTSNALSCHSRASSQNSKDSYRLRETKDMSISHSVKANRRHSIQIDVKPENYHQRSPSPNESAKSFYARPGGDRRLNTDVESHTDTMSAALVQSAEKTRQLLMAVEKSFNSELPPSRRARAISNGSSSSFRDENHTLCSTLREKRLSLDAASLNALQKDNDVLLERRRSLLKLRTDQLLARQQEHTPKKSQESHRSDRLSRQMYNEELRQLKHFAASHDEGRDRYYWKKPKDELEDLRIEQENLPDRTKTGSAPPVSLSRIHDDKVHNKEFESVQRTSKDLKSQPRRNRAFSALEDRHTNPPMISNTPGRLPPLRDQTDRQSAAQYARHRRFSGQYRLENAKFPGISEEETKLLLPRSIYQDSTNTPTDATLSSSSVSTENVSIASDDIYYSWPGKADSAHSSVAGGNFSTGYPMRETISKPQARMDKKEAEDNTPPKPSVLHPRLHQRRKTTTAYHESRLGHSSVLRARGSTGALEYIESVENTHAAPSTIREPRKKTSFGDNVHQSDANPNSVTESAKQVLASIRQRRRNTIEKEQPILKSRPAKQDSPKTVRLQTSSQRADVLPKRSAFATSTDSRRYLPTEEAIERTERYKYSANINDHVISSKHQRSFSRERSNSTTRLTAQHNDTSPSFMNSVSDCQQFDVNETTQLRSPLSRLPQRGPAYRHGRHNLY